MSVTDDTTTSPPGEIDTTCWRDRLEDYWEQSEEEGWNARRDPNLQALKILAADCACPTCIDSGALLIELAIEHDDCTYDEFWEWTDPQLYKPWPLTDPELIDEWDEWVDRAMTCRCSYHRRHNVIDDLREATPEWEFHPQGGGAPASIDGLTLSEARVLHLAYDTLTLEQAQQAIEWHRAGHDTLDDPCPGLPLTHFCQHGHDMPDPWGDPTERQRRVIHDYDERNDWRDLLRADGWSSAHQDEDEQLRQERQELIDQQQRDGWPLWAQVQHWDNYTRQWWTKDGRWAYLTKHSECELLWRSEAGPDWHPPMADHWGCHSVTSAYIEQTHGGCYECAALELEKQGYGQAAATTTPEGSDGAPATTPSVPEAQMGTDAPLPAVKAAAATRGPLEWGTLLTQELPPVNWIAGGFVAEGEQSALVGNGKVGKSLLALELAYRASRGEPFLDVKGAAPITVLYVDQENSPRMVISRMKAMSFEYNNRLVYLSLPNLPPLDTPHGAAALLDQIGQHRPGLVILDTVSRFVSGPENVSDTWMALYRLCLAPMKERGVAVLRLDHLGKDSDRGARGSSAKTQDVDHAWTMNEVNGQFLLERSHTRTGEGPDRMWVRRHGERGQTGAWYNTRHEISDGPDADTGAVWIVQETLIRWIVQHLGAEAGERKIMKAKDQIESETGVQITNTRARKAIEVIRTRVQRGQDPVLPQVPELPAG